jgi:uncharacterized membrane protein
MKLTAFVLFFGLSIFFTIITYSIRSIIKNQSNDEAKERFNHIQGGLYTAIILSITGIIICLFFLVRGSVYEGHVIEWLNIIVRVMHITFGIAWIGASFYFVFLENALNRTENVREELAGNLWAVHGGGFYYLEKYKVAPKKIPEHLHWFKYEAYFTWISGFALLFIVYYFNASAMLVDPNVLKLSAVQAVSISIGSFVLAWFVYDLLCKSLQRKKSILFVITGSLLLVGFAWFYSRVFSGRAAFIHFGAMIGSIMVANVFFVIIPAQKAMVAAAKKDLLPDPEKGKNALFRSIHNNYFTLPVLFVMVSNHFPSTFGNRYQWIILAIITLATAGIKHWLNIREQGKFSVWILPASILMLLSAAYISAPTRVNTKCNTVSFGTVNTIIQERCISCHSSKPSDNVYTTAPNGVKYDTPAEIAAKKDLIMQRVVITKTMPLNNKTNITPEERDLIRCWLEQGAKVN